MIFNKTVKSKNARQTLISFIGLDNRSTKAFELFFKISCHDKYAHVEKHEEASITIVDIDAYNIGKQVKEFCQSFSERQLIVLSTHQSEFEFPNSHLVRKPIKHVELSKLLDVIDKKTHKNVGAQISSDVSRNNHGKEKSEINTIKEVKEKAVKRTPAAIENKKYRDTAQAAQLIGVVDEKLFVGSHPDMDLEKPRDVLKIFYSPKNMFQGALQKGWDLAKQNRETVEVKFLEHAVYLDGVNHLAMTELSDSVLRPMCLLESKDTPTFSSIDNKTVKERLQAHGRAVRSCTIESFIWKISLWSSRGRIPDNTDIYKPVFLSEWPNLTRLQQTPHALRIAALIAHEPIALCDVIKELKIPQRYVFGFYSAVNALGIAGVSRRTVDSLFEVQQKRFMGERSVLRKLLGRLTHTVGGESSSHAVAR